MFYQDQEKKLLAWRHIKNMTHFTEFVWKNLHKNQLIGAEIGVRDGTNAIYLLENLPIKKLYLIDNFLPYRDRPDKYYTAEEQEEEYKKLLLNMERYYDKVIIIRQSSQWARQLFSKDYFDFVYIDADHKYESIKDDLNWWDKIIVRGIIGGHDYGYGNMWDFGVKKAVDEFAKEKGLSVEDLSETVGSRAMEWAIIKNKPRGGSKRIPKKNIKFFKGKPLIFYTIDEANKSPYLDRVIVSTDDEEIANISVNYGAEVIKRPKRLAQDDSPIIDTIFHILDRVEADIVVCLQPTSPLRTVEDINKAIKLFLKGGYESVISFSKYGPNGAIYISTPQNLKKYKSFYASKIRGYIMPPERSIDIDTPRDFRKAQKFYNRRGRNKS